MKSRMNSLNRLVACLAAGVFSVSLAATASAQGTQAPPGAGPPPNNNPRIEERGRQASESGLRSAEMDAAVESEKQHRVQAAVGHMKEDYSRIQVLRNDIARNLVAHKPLDYVLIADQTAEINKRANEMNVFMMARAADDQAPDKPSELKSDEMVGALVRLCKLIDSFTENPTLKNASTINANEVDKAKENKAKADKDLLAIIKLSESIKKTSDSLKAPK